MYSYKQNPNTFPIIENSNLKKPRLPPRLSPRPNFRPQHFAPRNNSPKGSGGYPAFNQHFKPPFFRPNHLSPLHLGHLAKSMARAVIMLLTATTEWTLPTKVGTLLN
jgi:hypothetical protein